jgi:hypothetical protein
MNFKFDNHDDILILQKYMSKENKINIDTNTKTLESHGEILKSHEETFKSHEETLKSHAIRFASNEETLIHKH